MLATGLISFHWGMNRFGEDINLSRRIFDVVLTVCMIRVFSQAVGIWFTLVISMRTITLSYI